MKIVGYREAGPGVPPQLARRGVLVGAAAVALVSTMLGGCASAPKPTRIEGAIVAAADLNPSVSQRPSPLLVRIYELRSATAFNQADFMSLYQGDQSALAAELVARDEVMLQPGETRAYNRQLAPDTRFLGVFAAYRHLERATWRTVVAVPAGRTSKLSIRAEALAVSAAVQP